MSKNAVFRPKQKQCKPQKNIIRFTSNHSLINSFIVDAPPFTFAHAPRLCCTCIAHDRPSDNQMEDMAQDLLASASAVQNGIHCFVLSSNSNPTCSNHGYPDDINMPASKWNLPDGYTSVCVLREQPTLEDPCESAIHARRVVVLPRSLSQHCYFYSI